MMKNLAALVRAILVFFAVSTFATLPAQSRIIAILFDDSGSMTGKNHLPAFGAQLLVSTLEGRNSKDQLITAIMSDIDRGPASISNHPIRTRAQLERAIDTIRNWKNPVDGNGTPLEQISYLLDKIASMQKPDEEAFLIVLTDGAFSHRSDDDKSIAETLGLREKFTANKKLLSGPLRVEFLLMGPDTISEDGVKLSELAEKQGVRSALLEVYNGNSQSGKTDVRSAEKLVEAFKSIIARVTSTDRKGIDKYIKKQKSGMQISTPLAIRRIVSVSTGLNNKSLAVPEPDTNKIRYSDKINFRSKMRARDTTGPWANAKLKADTSQLVFEPPLPSGEHFIKYSKSPSDVFLLFQTAADLRQQILDENGGVVAPEANGIVRLAKGSKYTLAIEVHDTDSTGTHIVPVSKFEGNASFRALNNISGRQTDIKLQTAKNDNSTLGVLPADETGVGTVDSSMRIKGFVTAYSKALKYEVVEVNASLSLSLTANEDCPTCADDEIAVTLGVGDQELDVAELTLSQSSQIAGEIVLSIADAPDGLYLSKDGKKTTSVTIATDGKGRSDHSFQLVVSATATKLLNENDGRLPFNLVASATAPLSGSVRKTGTLVFSAPDARMTYTGNSQDPSGAKDLTLDIDNVASGLENLEFAVYDNLIELDPEDFNIDTDSWLLSFEPVIVDNRISFQPSVPFLCDCFLYFDQGVKNVRVDWKSSGGLQSASANATFETRVPFKWQAAIACGKLILLFLAMLYLIWAFRCWMLAKTFPAGSGLDVTYSKRGDPIFKPLSRNNWTILKALLFPIFGIPHQRISMEGMTMQAARGGAVVNLRKSNQTIRFDSLGMSIAEKVEFEPRSQSYKFVWGDRASVLKSSMTILRKAADRKKRSAF